MVSYRIYTLLIIGHFQVVCEAFGQLIIQSVVLLRLKTLIQECANMKLKKKKNVDFLPRKLVSKYVYIIIHFSLYYFIRQLNYICTYRRIILLILE